MSTFLGWNGLHWMNVLAGLMTLLVMLDAFIGHYRSGFAVKAQYAPFVVGALLLSAVVLTVIAPRQTWVLEFLYIAGVLGVIAGIVGVGFHHYYAITTKPGGYGWLLHHLMYHAPQLAPLALSAVGLLAMVAARGLMGGDSLFGVRLQSLALLLVAVTLLGAALQAAMLHYRGAFNNPLMYAPLTTPLLAAVAVPWLIVSRGHIAMVSASALFWVTFLVGFVGLGMHLRGFDRMMGGLRLARMNMLEGPAMTAPALFTGFAAAGLAALHLL